MNQITNSTIKEGIRLRHEEAARNREYQINSRVNAEISQLGYSSPPSGGIQFLIVIALVIIFAIIGKGMGFLIGLGAGIVVIVLIHLRVKNENKAVDTKKKQLRDAANAEIRNTYLVEDEKAMQEMAAYDREVKRNSQKILQNPDTLTSMVDHMIMMFERMISHADSGAHIKYIETDFIYHVKKTGISYNYTSTYTNPQDDFNFNKQRYRDLLSDAECEGLAEALAKLTIQRMKKKYPPNSLSITVSHNDALVTLHFKSPNKNFVVARNIL